MDSDIHIQQENLFEVKESTAENFQAVFANISPESLNANVVERAGLFEIESIRCMHKHTHIK
jgi:hypothetical protein